MPNMSENKSVPSPWGELTFEAVCAPLSKKRENGCAEGASTAAPSRCANGKARAKRAAQFMPFAALTGYSDLIREQERKAQERFKKDTGKTFGA